MQKKDIAERIQQAAGISGEQAAALLDGILNLFKATLQKGEPITIPGFGKFTVRGKAPRPGRNPRTGEKAMISARTVVSFRASLVLKAEVNSVQAEKQDGDVNPGLYCCDKDGTGITSDKQN
ncbi:MAG: integration host factor subunit alpha [Nitrospirales bacterium]